MTKDEIAKIINPEYPWVYAPTTYPTRLLMRDGIVKMGYFQFTRSSNDLEKLNKFTFIEFGENAEFYKATGDDKYTITIDAKDVFKVEYPVYDAHEMTLKLIIDQLDQLRRNLFEAELTRDKLIFLIGNYRLDWGISSPKDLTEKYTPGATQQILLDKLENQNAYHRKRSVVNSNNKIISLLYRFIDENVLTKNMLLELHELIFNEGSTFRHNPATANKRIQIDFSYVHPSKIELEIDKLLNWYTHESEVLKKFHPLFLAAIFHYRFVCIHPFADGNGRIARILTSVLLLRNGIPPPIVKIDDRVIYIDTLQKADAGDIEAWIEFLGKKIIISIRELLSRI